MLNEWDQFYEMCSKNNKHMKQLSDGDDKVKKLLDISYLNLMYSIMYYTRYNTTYIINYIYRYIYIVLLNDNLFHKLLYCIIETNLNEKLFTCQK